MPKVLPPPLPVMLGTFELRADAVHIGIATHNLAFVPTVYRQVKLALDADRRTILKAKHGQLGIFTCMFITIGFFDEWRMP